MPINICPQKCQELTCIFNNIIQAINITNLFLSFNSTVWTKAAGFYKQWHLKKKKKGLQGTIRKGKKNTPKYFGWEDYGQIIKYLSMHSNFTRYQDTEYCYGSKTRLLPQKGEIKHIFKRCISFSSVVNKKGSKLHWNIYAYLFSFLPKLLVIFIIQWEMRDTRKGKWYIQIIR